MDKRIDMNHLLKRFGTNQKHNSPTSEEEMNEQFPFLDILISKRDDGPTKRSAYRKSK